MKKVKALILLFIITLFTIVSKTQATVQEIQILKKSDTEYIIYLENNLQTEFEFAFSNDKNANKEELIYKVCGKDTDDAKNANSIVYINSDIYNTYFLNETYLWVRDINEQYLIQSFKIDLTEAIERNAIDRINNITKIIKVETQNNITTKYMENEVDVTKIIGKIDVLEDGTTYYKLIELPNTYECNELMKLVSQMKNNEIGIDMYSKLSLVKQFKELFDKSLPNEWEIVQNNVILQPEDSKDGKQYILFLKNEKEDGTIKLDAQFLISFEEYNERYINEKISSKLPITNDNPILYIILTILFISFILLITFKVISNKKIKG